MERNVERAWERLVEALFDAEPEERRVALTEIEGYVKELPATFTSWEEDEKECAEAEPPKRATIVSLTPGKEDAIAFAQLRANDKHEPFGVWEHVGLFGARGGDIAARHTFKMQPLSAPDPADEYALIACVYPKEDIDGIHKG